MYSQEDVRFSIKRIKDSGDVTGAAVDGEEETPEDDGSFRDAGYDSISSRVKIALAPGMSSALGWRDPYQGTIRREDERAISSFQASNFASDRGTKAIETR